MAGAVAAAAQLGPERWLAEIDGEGITLLPQRLPVASGWMSHGAGHTLVLGLSPLLQDDAGAADTVPATDVQLTRISDAELLADAPLTASPRSVAILPPDPRASHSRGDTAFDGRHHLFVWVNDLHLDGILLDADGNVVVPPFEVARAFYAQSAPRVVGLPRGGFVVAWVDRRKDAIKSDIFVRRFAADGRAVDPLEGVPISAGNAFEGSVALGVAADGDHVLLSWADARDARPDTATDVFGARFSVGGSLRDPVGFPIASEPGNKIPVDVRRDPSGSMSVYYLHDDPTLGGQLLRSRTVDLGRARNEACAQNQDCTSTLCVGGICVDDPCDVPCGQVADGLCVPSPHGSAPREFQCLGYVCDGLHLTCPSTCNTREDCSQGSECQDGRCFVKRACFDATTRVVEGARQSCAPYTCDAARSDCRTQCASIDDCAPGAVCDKDGVCRSAPAPAGGCAAQTGDFPEWAFASLILFVCGLGARARRRVGRR